MSQTHNKVTIKVRSKKTHALPSIAKYDPARYIVEKGEDGVRAREVIMRIEATRDVGMDCQERHYGRSLKGIAGDD